MRKPCQQCRFSPLCLPFGFFEGLNRIVRERAHEYFKGMVNVGIVDPRDQSVWRGVKAEQLEKLLGLIPDACRHKSRRMNAIRWRKRNEETV